MLCPSFRQEGFLEDAHTDLKSGIQCASPAFEAERNSALQDQNNSYCLIGMRMVYRYPQERKYPIFFG